MVESRSSLHSRLFGHRTARHCAGKYAICARGWPFSQVSSAPQRLRRLHCRMRSARTVVQLSA